MNGAFYIGATGLRAQERALDVVANNVTNVNTTAFKRGEVRFAELVGRAPGATEPSRAGPPAMHGVAADDGGRVFAQGDLRETGNPLDLAISGAGFIELAGPGGEVLLWRGGTLAVGEDGTLAAAGGLPLKAMIEIPAGTSAVSIDREGEVTAVLPGETEPQPIGRIELVLVRNMEGLTAIEGGLYRAGAEGDVVAAEQGEGAGALIQGSLEGSNVALTEEMVSLMMMQRAYAANAQIVQAGDQLMAIANGLKR